MVMGSLIDAARIAICKAARMVWNTPTTRWYDLRARFIACHGRA